MERSDEFHFPVIDAIKKRRSIRAFADKMVEQEKINSLFEATRWAPSSTNEQPWVFIYATKDQPDLWNKLFEPLNEGNRIWAKDAPLLIVSLARKNFTKYSGPNAHALYDLGAANAFLSLQAVDLGLQVRQMAGFDPDKAVAVLNIPEDFEIGVFMAVGYPGDPSTLPENLHKREMAPRERLIQDVFVMNRPFEL